MIITLQKITCCQSSIIEFGQTNTVEFDIQVVEDFNQLTYHVIRETNIVEFNIQVVEDFNQLTYHMIRSTNIVEFDIQVVEDFNQLTYHMICANERSWV